MVDYPHIGRAAQASKELENLDDDPIVADLLAACEALLTKFAWIYEDDHPGRTIEDMPEVQNARAAIAKAKGE